MKEKKNIDRLFQEKFKDYEVFPDPSVWQHIEKELEKKRKKRIVPLWLRYGSAAAILLLLISSYWYYNLNTTETQSDVDEIITKTDKIKDKDNTVNSEKEGVINNVISPTTKESVANQNSKGIIKQPLNSVNQNKLRSILKEEIANKSKEQIAEVKQEKIALEKIKSTQEKNTIDGLKINKEKDEAIALQETLKEKLLQKDIQKEVTVQEKTEEFTVATKSNNKWSVGSIISPVYYNTLSDGSPIDPSLKANLKSNNSSITYGLKVSYKLSDKLSFQSGINNLELGYTTANVATLLSSSLLENTSTNIETNIAGVSVSAISTDRQHSEAMGSRSYYDKNGILNQSFNYVEVPLELKYSVLQRKFGVNIIGGFSTYFLYQNEVTATSFGKTATLGEATNINDLNFSGNLGVDLEYNISKKIFINVSPMFKYQFNTFSKNSGGFQPYYLGVYTGVNFRF